MKTIKRIRTLGILFLTGTPSFLICSFSHVCMAGHLAHPSYPVWQWFSELLWVICYSSVVVFSMKTKAKRSCVFLIGGGCILVSRTFLGSGGGVHLLLELPLVLYLSSTSINYIKKPEAFSDLAYLKTS